MNSNHLDKIADKAKQNDDLALSELCKMVYPKLYSYAFYKVNEMEDAKDLAGDVLLKIIQELKSQKGRFLPWMYKIASNRIIDFYRHRAVKTKAAKEMVREQLSMPDNHNGEEGIKQWELKQNLAKLTEEQKDVIILKFIQGHTNDEAAEITGKTVGAIKVLQYRAIKSMNEKMQVG